MSDLIKILKENANPEYVPFQIKLTPGLTEKNVLGIKLPVLRKIAKQYSKNPESREFLYTLPHRYFEENLIELMLLEDEKDFDFCLDTVENFLPYINNWAVCDSKIPKIFQKNKDKILVKTREWIKSEHDFTCRYGIHMLMTLYLDGDFEEEYLEYPAAVHREEYYVNMMIAWFYATALAKQWDATIPYIENKVLDKWAHNKTIQKSIESYRISDEHKTYLRSLKIK